MIRLLSDVAHRGIKISNTSSMAPEIEFQNHGKKASQMEFNPQANGLHTSKKRHSPIRLRMDKSDLSLHIGVEFGVKNDYTDRSFLMRFWHIVGLTSGIQ